MKRSNVKQVRCYGCVKCQTIHREDLEPELFKLHILSQSKHGWHYIEVPVQPDTIKWVEVL